MNSINSPRSYTFKKYAFIIGLALYLTLWRFNQFSLAVLINGMTSGATYLYSLDAISKIHEKTLKAILFLETASVNLFLGIALASLPIIESLEKSYDPVIGFINTHTTAFNWLTIVIILFNMTNIFLNMRQSKYTLKEA